MKIYIAFFKDDPFNSQYFKIFWIQNHLKNFLKKNLGFSWKNDFFFLDQDDPLRKTIDNYKFIKKGERYDRVIH